MQGSPSAPSPRGLCPKVGFELIYCIFNALKLLIFLLILNFWAKPQGREIASPMLGPIAIGASDYPSTSGFTSCMNSVIEDRS